jgi:CheY-like chemotaxis protein
LGIVKNHHGFITVQSEIGRGTKFEIHLPATPDAVIPEPPKTAAVAKRGSGELVLLVDDEAHIVTATRKILESHGYTVVTAGDGIEALALFAREKDKIRLVVTDLLMPFLDGFGLVRGLKKMQPDIRIIVASGVAADRKWEEKIAELEALGVASVLAKPFQPEVLLDLLHDLLH